MGIDGSPALVARAERRVAADPLLRAARETVRLRLEVGDAREIRLRERFSLIVLAGVLPHLGGARDAERVLVAVRRRLTQAGRAVLDLPGPGAQPKRELPLAVDWERDIDGRRTLRRSRLIRSITPDGLVVAYSTLTDVERPDGTFAHLSAAFRLWYPSYRQLEQIVHRAGLAVLLVYGSHDLDRFSRHSQRLIVVAERARRHR